LIDTTMCPRLKAPIVLAHGLFGFSQIVVGGVTLAEYFRGIPEWLRAAGNRVLVTKVPPIAGIEARARRLGEQIAAAFPDEPVHLIGHSMGGLDARLLLSDPDWSRRVLSLTTIGTPHLGSWIADLAQLKAGRVYRLLTVFGIDHRGFLDVTRRNAAEFHRTVLPPQGLPCFSIAGNPSEGDVCWPLQRLHAALSELEGPNDGLVSVDSALAFGTPLPHWPIDHFRQMNWMVSHPEPQPSTALAPEPESEPTPAPEAGTRTRTRPWSKGMTVPIEFYAEAVANLAYLGFAADEGGTEETQGENARSAPVDPALGRLRSSA
jgi:triacylglycerol lipase